MASCRFDRNSTLRIVGSVGTATYRFSIAPDGKFEFVLLETS